MRFFSLLLGAALVFALAPLPVLAETAGTSYVDENGNTHTVTATVVEASTAAMSDGWYVVNGGITRTGTITVSGDVKLILADGASLTLYGDFNNAGINVSGSNRLTIYGQEQGTGLLAVTCGGNGAGIGGGYNETCGTVVICGGTVTATGNSGGAAIGGGENRGGGSIAIRGGTVTATGTSGGAAIGGGSGGAAGGIAISGGIITAKARNGGAAIGGGEGGDGGGVAISGGTVYAEALHDGAGIGCGAGGAAGDITITGGSVDVAEGGTSSVPHNGSDAPVYHTAITLFGIGERTRVDALSTDAGYTYGTKDLYTEDGGSVIRVWLPSGTKTTAARITDGASTPARQFYMGLVTTSSGSSSGVLYRQAFIVTSTGTGYTYANNLLTFTQPGTYGVSMAFASTTDRIRVAVPSGSGTVALTFSDVFINASGTDDAAFNMTGASVSLTLTGDNTLLGGTGKAGLQCPSGSTLTVTAESTGSLAATGGSEGAGIGGAYIVSGGNITINGGTVVATGGEDAAGIGCGDMLDHNMHYYTNNSRITVNGGTVTANGGSYGAGIGSGSFGGGGTIVINGGTVTANGGVRAPGIGSGDYAGINNANVTISGGVVQARGGAMAAGIGGGHLSSGGTIRISGGEVTATGGGRGQYGNGVWVSGGAGIGVGGGNDDQGFLNSTITISGGVVSAAGGEEAAGIGGGWRDGVNNDSVTISGGEVTATGGNYGAGIGGGISRPGGSISITAGTVRAYGGVAGAGLGGGTSGNGGSISIGGGSVTATGGAAEGMSFGGAAGIGSGGTSMAAPQTTNGGNITISGGTVTASGGSGFVGGAGIGGGYNGDAGNIAIRGGTVAANGGSYGAGIGGGAGGNGGSVAISGGSVKAAAGLGAEAIGKGNNGDSSGTRTNGAGRNVYLNTLTLSGVNGVNAIVSGSIGGVACAQTPDAANGVYGIKDVFTDASGKVYFYLPVPAEPETVNLTEGATTYGAAYQRLESGNSVTLEPLTGVAFTAEQTGGASGTADSTGIILTFSQPVTGLSLGDITITNGTGAAAAGALSGSGTTWTAALAGVTAEGTVTVSVRNFNTYNITTPPQTVTVYRQHVFVVTGGADGTDYTYSTGGVLTFAQSGTYEVSMANPGAANTTDKIIVTGGTTDDPADITLNGINIQLSSGCAFDIVSGAAVRLTLSGTNTLISGGAYAGLHVPEGALLTIGGAGELSATGGHSGAGIGGNYTVSGETGGNIAIEGGTITAQGGINGAGLGGGSGGAGGDIASAGGTVSARGGNVPSYNLGSGAGLGGGLNGNGGKITISGGTVTAAGSNWGAAIGGGSGGSGGIITISGGTVTAAGSNRGAGIGGGSGGAGGNITITGGVVTARSEGPFNDSGGGAGIGGGEYGNGGVISISGGTVNAYGGVREYGSGIGGGYHGAGGTITITGGTVNAYGSKYSAAIGGSFASAGTVSIQDGTVTATGGLYGAGIGGDGGSIAVEGGSVTASGGKYASGIGGNMYDDAGTVTIAGGTVTAAGGESAAGIGGGEYGKGGVISISGGNIFASGSEGQDIGAGRDDTGGSLAISGTAAVFLRNGVAGSLTPDTSTHSPYSLTNTAAGGSQYGIPVPWDGDFGAYLRLYTLEYSTNGGTGAPPLTVTQHIGTAAAVADIGNYERAGYALGSKWNVEPGGGGISYSPDDIFEFWANTTLYAQWTIVPYKITYDLDGGSVSPANPDGYTVEDPPITLINPTKSGYDFDGWSGTGITGGPIMTVTIPAGSTGDRTYTAHWIKTPPGYSFRTLTDIATGISVYGYMRDDAALTVQNISDPACGAIRKRMDDDDYIFLTCKDISLSQSYVGTLTIKIPVGAGYNGQTVTIIHCADGKHYTYTVKVANGKALLGVSKLSIFAVFAKNDESPEQDQPDQGQPDQGQDQPGQNQPGQNQPNQDLPEVVTVSVTEVSATGAKLGGNVVDGGGSEVKERGFVYGTVSDPVIGGAGVTNVTAGGGIGSFAATLTGLKPDTAYYVRAYAVNGTGTAYGAVIRFITKKDDTREIPAAGDDSAQWIWWTLYGVSAAGIIALIILIVMLRKRKKAYKR